MAETGSGGLAVAEALVDLWLGFGLNRHVSVGALTRLEFRRDNIGLHVPRRLARCAIHPGAPITTVGSAIRIQDPVIVLGVLIVILGCNPIAARRRLAGEGEVFFQYLLKVSAHADFLVATVLHRYPARGSLWTAIATPPPTLEIWPWLHVSHDIRLLIALEPQCGRGGLLLDRRRTGARRGATLLWIG